jgi:hypothetical protein
VQHAAYYTEVGAGVGTGVGHGQQHHGWAIAAIYQLTFFARCKAGGVMQMQHGLSLYASQFAYQSEFAFQHHVVLFQR